ncbi:MAG: hypothetical protein J6Q69_01275, partial [Clostridia bacterium]|nr:hypothetical protein [Clostridia bacterium]
EAIRNTPPVNAVVKTQDGVGTVVETKPLLAEIKVKLGEGDKETVKLYKVRDVKVLKMPGRGEKAAHEDEEIKED